METPVLIRPETVERLHQLIGLNIDAAKGFRQAAEHVENPGVNQTLRIAGETRAGFAEQLQALVASSGVEPTASGTSLGTVHRWWLSLRGTVAVGEEHAVLAEAERGEDVIKKAYEKVLAESVGGPLGEVLVEQYTSVKRTHDHIRTLREETAGDVRNGAVPKAEAVTAHDAYWRSQYQARPYVEAGSTYDEFEPAYRFGWELATRYRGKSFADAEPSLQRDWEAGPHASRMNWVKAKKAIYDAWERATDIR
jgi:uncharacterized protein (TIGR02284 family)